MKKVGKKQLIIYFFISILLIGVLITVFGGKKTFFEAYPECSGGLQVANINNVEVNDKNAIMVVSA